METNRQYTAKTCKQISPNIQTSFSAQKGQSKFFSAAVKKAAYLAKFKRLEEYRRLIGIELQQEKCMKFKNKFQLEHKSFLKYKHRLRNQDLFLKFNNPFSIHKHKRQRSAHVRSVSPGNRKQSSGSNEKKIRNIVNIKDQFLQKSKKKNIMHRLKQYQIPSEQRRIYDELKNKKKLPNILGQQQHRQISYYNDIDQINQKHVRSSFYPQRKTNQTFLSQEQESATFSSKRLKKQLLWLHNLVATKEQSFMWKNLKDRRLNIFGFLANPDSPQFQSLRWILDKHNFCSESFLTRNFLKSSIIHREISRTARWHMQGRYKELQRFSDKVHAQNLYLNLEKLQFDELMLVGSGRLQANVLKDYLENQVQQSQSMNASVYQILPKVSSKAISNKLQHHKKSIFRDQNYQKQQSELYYLRPMSSQQFQQLQLSTRYKQQIDGLIQIERILKLKKIEDVKLHQQIQKEHHRLLSLLNSSIVGQLHAETNIQKRIYMGKEYKDKKEVIKNMKLKEAVHHKKSVEREMSKKKKWSRSSRAASLQTNHRLAKN